MYVDQVKLEGFRTFRSSEIELLHPDYSFDMAELPRPLLPNVNLLLGNNGAGKTAFLKALALACLGPAVRSSGTYAYQLVRREPNPVSGQQKQKEARIDAVFLGHAQDRVRGRFESAIAVRKVRDLEEIEWVHGDAKEWHPVLMKSPTPFSSLAMG